MFIEIGSQSINVKLITSVEEVDASTTLITFSNDNCFNVSAPYSWVKDKIKAAEDKERMDKYACAVIASGQVMNLMALKYIEVPHAACDHMHNIDNFQNIQNEAT